MYTLEFLSNTESHSRGKTINIQDSIARLGRSNNCTIQFGEENNTVSREHAALQQEGNEVHILNLSSTNSTLVNGHPIHGKYYLSDGDEIQLSSTGPTLRFKQNGQSGYKTASANNPATQRADLGLQAVGNKELQGVGGWLKFFCVMLTIIGPIVSLLMLAQEWQTPNLSALFKVFPTLRAVVVIESLMQLGILIYGIIIGIMIWNGNKKGKILAERYLLVRLSVFVVGEIALIAMLSDLPDKGFAAGADSALSTIILQAIFFGVWYSYFKNSKRVAATYGA